MSPERIIVTCEHATAAVPHRFRDCFRSDPGVLHTHRAYDPGALGLAVELARKLGSRPPVTGTMTRLLVDLNRSLRNPRVFSEFSPPAGDPRRQLLVAHYLAYRREVTGLLVDLLAGGGEALHLSIHTFTPSLGGRERSADIGLLYDPGRPREKAICRAIHRHLRECRPGLRTRFNYPYRGVSDGFTRALRKELGPRYIGIELELNHGSYRSDCKAWRHLHDATVSAALGVLGDDFPP